MAKFSSDLTGKFSAAPRGSYQNNPVSPSELKFIMKSRKYESDQIMKKSFIFWSFNFFFYIA